MERGDTDYEGEGVRRFVPATVREGSGMRTLAVGLPCLGRIGLGEAAIAIAVTVLASATALYARTDANALALQPPCVGDCNGDGQVTIDEILTMVNIALGNLDIASCMNGDANGDGHITIDEILTAVNNALNGCAPTPPTPTATPTNTPVLTPTPTATATQTPLNVSGSWREDQYALASSTCPAPVNAEILNLIAQLLPCDYMLSQNGSTVHILDCGNTMFDASVDTTGTIQLDFPPVSDSEQGCTVVQTVHLVIPAGHSPTTASYGFHFEMSGACIISRCDLTVQSRWTRL